MTAVVISTVTIHNVELDLIRAQGKLWLEARGLAVVLGYKSESGIRMAYYRHQRDERLKGHSIKANVSGYGGSDARLFDQVAIRYFCEYTKRSGAFHLLRWLDEGGMQGKCVDVDASEVSPQAAPATPKAPVLELVPNSHPEVPKCQRERTKAYCRELLRALVRYANDAEAEHLVQVIEAEIAGLLSARYCQGLNAARYELYRRYWLQGGGK